ncbi:class I mannose-6-phosphate isomerase [Sciscionella marina]|uniref:class I mannose-6-phosphate isomerase n=1 Tax=Sciscionella marina TaxID=508770 RepID=UPI0003607821|nr:class I mannose-6-phosphate isomerase [Sciscionella marina]
MNVNGPAPAVLAANQPEQFYRGGAAIARLRGMPASAEYGPEDWVASTTTRFGHEESGLSRLPDGTLLREAIKLDPYSWLGPAHTARFGSDPALLVKLLDAGQRLPVHCHPSDGFAQRHLDSSFGKTEAWVVLETNGEDPCVYAGFREDVDEETLRTWVENQDSAAMLGALNRLEVAPGDTVFIPAGLPHAIGEGVFIAELQQPTDLSITLEWKGFLADAETGSLGMGFDLAMFCVDRTGWEERRLGAIVHRAEADAPCRWLLDGEQERYFRAHRLSTARGVLLRAGYSVLIVLEGELRLIPENGEEMVLSKGNTAVIPYAAGAIEAIGEATSIHCRPPAPGEPA